MKFSSDFLAMALLGLATVVAVAAILVTSDLLRRFVLFLIARVEDRRDGAAKALPRAARPPPGRVVDGGPARPRPVSQSETLPG